MSADHPSGSLITVLSTTAIAFLPDEVLTYGGKVLSVLLLAMVAELGRRVVGAVWNRKNGG